MYNFLYVVFIFLLYVFLSGVSLQASSNEDQVPMYAWVGCDGTAVTRTEVGKIVMTHISPNLPNCNGPKNTSSTSTGTIDRTMMSSTQGRSSAGQKKNIILLDLSQRDIVNYRIESIRQQQIRYANAIRSLRVRSGKSLEAHTNGYLMRNDAVHITGDVHGWTPVRTGKMVVTDTRENTIAIDTSSGISGYAGTRYLRDATPSDLVKIGQADIAYWTNLVHTNVAHLVNIRSNPWYTAPIVQTVPNNVQMYHVATVDNWSQVQSMDGTVHGFIRSDFLIIDKTQLNEIKPLLK